MKQFPSEDLKIETIDEEISNMEAEMNRNKIFKHFKSFSEDPGNINVQEMCKTMNKV